MLTVYKWKTFNIIKSSKVMTNFKLLNEHDFEGENEPQ